MDENRLIAVAGLLHEIGKFKKRVNNSKESDIELTKKAIKEIFEENGKSLIEKKTLDEILKYIDPSSNKIIKISSKLSKGLKSIDLESDPKRLKHIFQGENKNIYFPLNRLEPNNIFPSTKDSSEDDIKLVYGELWEEFLKEVKGIYKYGISFPDEIKIDTIESILKRYTSFMPAHFEDISLFEHLKTTSIFASAITAMDNKIKEKLLNLDLETIESKDIYKEKIFTLIAGDFFGIQNFIFDNVSTKFSAKILRAKSAYVQILVRVLALYITEKLKISKYSIISTHAGKFEILAPKSDSVAEVLKEIQNEFNEIFSQEFFGLTGVGVTSVDASIADFIGEEEIDGKNRYKQLRDDLAKEVEEMKFQKFGLSKVGYRLFEVDEDLNNQNLCEFCHKRRGKQEKEYVICTNCNRFVEIGKSLATNSYMSIKKKGVEKERVFKDFYLDFFNAPSKHRAKDDIAIFNIKTDSKASSFEKWELSSYVARKDDFSDFRNFLIDRDESFFDNDILSLGELASLSVREGIIDNKREFGVEAIMALKGDADGMGKFIRDSDITDSFAKYNFFARMVDYYFSVYVPITFMEKKPLYTVFAGGDDLFVLGSWDETLKLAKSVRDGFEKFTSKRLSFSVGLTLSKANKPVKFLADISEEALEEAKAFCCKIDNKECKPISKDSKDRDGNCMEGKKGIKIKDALNLFNETVSWSNYSKVKEEFNKSFKHPKDEEFATSFLYKLIDFSNMSKEVKFNEEIRVATIWRSKLSYIYFRNISEDKTDLLQFLERIIERYPQEFKLALFEYIYKRRKH